MIKKNRLTRRTGDPNWETDSVTVLICHDVSAQAKINAVRAAVEFGDERLTVQIDADEPFATTLRRAVLLAGGRIYTSTPRSNVQPGNET